MAGRPCRRIVQVLTLAARRPCRFLSVVHGLVGRHRSPLTRVQRGKSDRYFNGTPRCRSAAPSASDVRQPRLDTARFRTSNRPEHPRSIRRIRCTRRCGESCLLVRVEVRRAGREIFGDYAYFSSFSDSVGDDARRPATGDDERAPRHEPVPESPATTVPAAPFAEAGSRTLASTAATSLNAGRRADIETPSSTSSASLAERVVSAGRRRTWFVANNVLAHVPDRDDFVEASVLLRPGGVIFIEVRTSFV